MTKRILLSLSVLLAAFLFSSCGRPPAPDSFTLAIQIGRNIGTDQITLDNVDAVTLLFEPMMEGSRPPAEFSEPMMTSFEDGEIMVSVDANGLLTLLVSRAYVLENAVTMATGENRLELELWTADQMTHMPAPRIRGTVTRMGNQIGIGSVSLAQWPLPPGGEAQLAIPCATGMATLCTATR